MFGGRVTHTGPRAAGHSEATAGGAAPFITKIDWKPYTLVDIFAQYKISDDVSFDSRVENLTDTFYVDPLGLVLQPARVGRSTPRSRRSSDPCSDHLSRTMIGLPWYMVRSNSRKPCLAATFSEAAFSGSMMQVMRLSGKFSVPQATQAPIASDARPLP